MRLPGGGLVSAGPNVAPASVDWKSEYIWFATPIAITRVPLTGSRNTSWSGIARPGRAAAVCQPQLRSSLSRRASGWRARTAGSGAAASAGRACRARCRPARTTTARSSPPSVDEMSPKFVTSTISWGRSAGRQDVLRVGKRAVRARRRRRARARGRPRTQRQARPLAPTLCPLRGARETNRGAIRQRSGARLGLRRANVTTPSTGPRPSVAGGEPPGGVFAGAAAARLARRAAVAGSRAAAGRPGHDRRAAAAVVLAPPVPGRARCRPCR